MNKVIFTNCGLLGDMFLCLPVLSWYYKEYNKKITFALSTHFPYAKNAEEILRMQDCIEDVLYFDYGDGAHENRTSDNLGQYHIKKEMFDCDTLISLGFHKWPDKYLPEFYAEEYGFGVDYDFKLNYGEPDYHYKDHIIKLDKFESPRLLDIDGLNLPSNNTIVSNLQLAAGAKKVITWTTGASIMLTLARIPITLYQPQGLEDHHRKYYDINGCIDWKTI